MVKDFFFGRRANPAWVAARWAVGLFIVLGLVSSTYAWRLAELKGFDLLTVATTPGPTNLPITIVGIDEASFAEIKKQWPWPRSIYADLIRSLNRAGAALIVFDVMFSEPSTPTEDRALEDAIFDAGNVVLAADMDYRETAHTRQWIRVNPLPQLVSAGAAVGLASVDYDGDRVMRHFPESRESLWRVTVDRFDALHPGMLPPVNVPPGAMIRWLGPDHTFPYISFYQALKADEFLPPGVLADNIVIVGRDVRASPDPRSTVADVFGSPYLAWTHWLTPGVELQATLLENAIAGSTIRELPLSASLGLLAAALALAAQGMANWRPLRSAFVGLALMGLIALLDWWLFQSRQQWLPAGMSGAGILSLYLSLGAEGFLKARRRQREIRQAFALYVSPQVVDQVIADPEKLKLGGQRKTLTVMFTDLAGFTSLSEAMEPEEVAHLLNRHLTDMTRIVFANKGTVDKFIGDAIMAFWGAPLDDEDQAANACRAAAEMDAEMAKLRKELAAQGAPELFMRVGIHRGSAVVGNMGADNRFDYTAIGDTVNLASRLEGANKVYGTHVLISAAAKEAAPDIVFRVVDLVQVKGKKEPVEVFTVGADEALAAATETAVAAYRKQDWDVAEQGFREILHRHSGDEIAKLYLQRIAAFRVDPPGPDWKGVTRLTEK